MSETKINYQWIKGDKAGTVESLLKEEEDEGLRWTYFESGRRINSSVINEFLILLPNGEIPMEMEITKDSPLHTVASSAPLIPKQSQKSPLRSLLEKQKNTKKESISIKVEIEIPTKDIFSILGETFGEEEMMQEVEKLALEKISIENLSITAKEQLQQFIKRYYESNA
jgi:hypothetical protein